jgi:hypothetical protein
MGNLQVRFLEGWAPAMAPGYSTLRDYGRVARDSGGTDSRNYGLLHYADFPVLILGAHLDYILMADKN